MPTIATSSAKTEFKYLMTVLPTSLDALRVRQVGASRVWWNAVLALMYFLSAILARFNVGFRLVRSETTWAIQQGSNH